MKRLGVIGTFVWDVIHGRQPHSVPVEEWGGITYSLSALDAALPRDWEIVPIMKIGSDLADRARQFIHGLQRIAADAALVEVPYPNNRVELRYFSDERRTEMLSGGVPGWTWLALTPLIEAARLDALYVNFLSGWEMDLDTAQALRRSFRGPMYADLHMLVMAVQADGLRVPRPLSNVREWCGCFDRLGDLERKPLAAAGAIRTELLPAERVANPLDPTGCGDVWGATYFSRLLAGDKLEDAIRAAHRAAARNVEHRGATGLADHLRGKLGFT